MKAFVIAILICIVSCQQPQDNPPGKSLDTTAIAADTIALTAATKPNQINTGNTSPAELLQFARSLMGIPYKYGSADPVNGFDCSGFITYVFNHFNIDVPRSSVAFTDVPTQIALSEALPGDIILFTGTDNTIREVGHMGIIISRKQSELEFIHSTSGKANGVTITLLNDYYMGRFVKIIRVFPQQSLVVNSL